MSEAIVGQRVSVRFRSSAARGGIEAYEVVVETGATDQDVDAVMAVAARARRLALAVLADEASA